MSKKKSRATEALVYILNCASKTDGAHQADTRKSLELYLKTPNGYENQGIVNSSITRHEKLVSNSLLVSPHISQHKIFTDMGR